MNVAPDRRCEHGIRWPWACSECDEAALAERTPTAATHSQEQGDCPQAVAGHTPGPWFTLQSGNGDKWLISSNVNADGEELDRPTNNGGIYVAHAIGPDREANAKLIACAPEMLAELKNASWLLADLSPDGLVKRQIDAVISKAEGWS